MVDYNSIRQFFNKVVQNSPYTPETIAPVLQSKEIVMYPPAVNGETLIAFKIIGDVATANEDFKKWCSSFLNTKLYLEPTKSGAIAWVRINLDEGRNNASPDPEPIRKRLTVFDYESFVVGLDQAYKLFDDSPNRLQFNKLSKTDDRTEVFPLPLLHSKLPLEQAYNKLLTSKISLHKFYDGAGRKFPKEAAAYKATIGIGNLSIEVKRLYDVDDSERSRMAKIVSYLTKKLLRTPKIDEVQAFWKESKLETVDNAGGYDSFWMDTVNYALDMVEERFSVEKEIARAQKYKLHMWDWLVQSVIKEDDVIAAKLSYAELELVLGIITKSCLSIEYKGISKRDGILAMADKMRIRTGLRIEKNKLPDIIELLIKYNLIILASCPEHKTGYSYMDGKAKVYRLGVKHPMFKLAEMINERVTV